MSKFRDNPQEYVSKLPDKGILEKQEMRQQKIEHNMIKGP